MTDEQRIEFSAKVADLSNQEVALMLFDLMRRINNHEAAIVIDEARRRLNLWDATGAEIEAVEEEQLDRALAARTPEEIAADMAMTERCRKNTLKLIAEVRVARERRN